jgi:membrane protease YdiL (CAAX protease family)
VLVVVLAPLFEEFIFRGLLFRSLRRATGLPLAVAGSAAVFAVIHPPVSFLPVFVLGVVAALAFERTRLLWAPIAAHAVYNGALVVWPP